jgi:hypothetical protein
MTDSEALLISAVVVFSITGAIVAYAVRLQTCPRELKGYNCRAGTRLTCECEEVMW